MAHGGGHHHDDAELAAALHGEMPEPYCRSRWRETVTVMGVSALLVAGITVERHFAGGGSVIPEAVAAMPQSSGTAVPTAGTVPVAGMVMDQRNFRLVAGSAPGTDFNVAAQGIRPSVVGVRASLGSAAPGVVRERVGSGVVVDPSGYVVTANHVITGATAISVSRYGQPDERLPARVVAVEGDLALIQVPGAIGVPAARVADSGSVRVGDWILAVGHPFGLGLTVTAGIVGRRHGDLAIAGGQRYTDLLQTDAPINEGSSGGPLVNLNGEVVGLNTAIYAPTGVFSGAGFAIPSNRVRDFVGRALQSQQAPVWPRG